MASGAVGALGPPTMETLTTEAWVFTRSIFIWSLGGVGHYVQVTV